MSQAVAARRGRVRLIAAMAVVVAAIAGLATWDAERESAAALRDFALEQATLARALGAAVALRAASGTPLGDDDVIPGLGSVARPGALAILVRGHGETLLRDASDGRRVTSARLVAALDHGDTVVRIPREEAAAFGLPGRTALAGLARVTITGGIDEAVAGPAVWDIVAVASAERERDRGVWARRRLVLSVLTAAGLVLVFGGLAMRNQRNELVLERELAIADLRQNRDERLQRASRAAAMGTLAMGVAHEISTPLGVIAARAEQMAPRVAGDDRLSAGVAAILSQTDRINQVIRGLLGLARGEAPSSERIDLHTLVDNAVSLVEHRFAKAGVALHQDIEDALPSVLGDPRLLEHALVNLLLNACDACASTGAGLREREGAHEVLVRARRDGAEVEIAVEDSGIGISLRDVDRALEPFFTTKAREGGTGLGLAIAQEIVASHRGRLVFARGESTGTRAAMRLPPVEVLGDGHG